MCRFWSVISSLATPTPAVDGQLSRRSRPDLVREGQVRDLHPHLPAGPFPRSRKGRFPFEPAVHFVSLGDEEGDLLQVGNVEPGRQGKLLGKQRILGQGIQGQSSRYIDGLARG